MYYAKLVIHRALRYIRPYLPIIPRWSSVIKNNKLPQNSRSNLKIIIATSTGSNWSCSSFESLLGIALSLRGADVRFLLCDGVLAACQECDNQWISESSFSRNGPKNLCSTCFNPAFSMLNQIGLPILCYSDYIFEEEKFIDPSSPSVHAIAGALRYYGRGILPTNNEATIILNRYQSAAKMTAQVIKRLINDQKPDIAIFHHGIYVPQGIVGEKFREAGVKVINWAPSYRKGTVLFSHNNTYHHTMIDESASEWCDIDWSEIKEKYLIAYLQSRWTGNNDWINFQVNPDVNKDKIANSLDLNLDIPIIGLLTNVMWDAQLHFEKSAFTNMLEWVFFTINSFISRKDIQLIIRIHPGEIYGTVPSKQLVADEIKFRFGEMPKHIKIVGPEMPISTYALMEMCDSVLVYGTKTSLELACFGMPVIVSGEAWCKGKGFTIDVSTSKEYEKILNSLPLKYKLSDKQIQMARKYAYHFYFRRMIPISYLIPLKSFGLYKIKLNSINDLLPGKDPGLDVICSGILTGNSFVYNS